MTFHKKSTQKQISKMMRKRAPNEAQNGTKKLKKVIKNRARTMLRRMMPELELVRRLFDRAEEQKHEKT